VSSKSLTAASDGKRVFIETGLYERAGGRLLDGGVVMPRIRHARTRFVDDPANVMPALPIIAWSPLPSALPRIGTNSSCVSINIIEAEMLIRRNFR
jgi:hypothetical protein